jgi:hypothetical protein
MESIQDLSASRNQVAIAAAGAAAEPAVRSASGSISSAGDSASRRTYLAVVAIFLLNAVWFIWSHRFLPLQDYPDWLYQGFILSKLFRQSAAAAFSVRRYPVPDSTFTFVLAVLDLGLPPEMSGKIVLTLMVVLFVFGSIYLLTAFQPRETPLHYVPLLLCFNSFLLWGNCAYYLGLTIFFFFCGYLLRRRSLAKRALLSIALLLLFMTHLLPYLAALCVMGVVALAEVKKIGRRALVTAFLIASPSMLLVVWYAVGRFHSGELAGHGWVWWYSRNLFASAFIFAFAPFHIFLPFVSVRGIPMRFAALLNVGWAAMVLLVLVLAVRASLRSERPSSLAARCATALMIAFVLAGYNIGLGNTGERFLIPAMLLACCWLASVPTASTGRPAMLLRLSLISMVCMQALWLDTAAALAADALGATYAEMKRASDRGSLCSVYNYYFERSWTPSGPKGIGKFLPNTAGALRIPYYFYIEQDTPAPVLPFGLIHFKGPGSYNNLCENVAPR